MMKDIYLDTSAINYLANLSDDEIDELKRLMKNKKHQFIISEIGLIEIFNNKNVDTREKLIITLQKIKHIKLATNVELYLLKAFGVEDDRLNGYEKLSEPLKNTLMDVLENDKKTFIFDQSTEFLFMNESRYINKTNSGIIKIMGDESFCNRVECIKKCGEMEYCDMYIKNFAFNLAILLLTHTTISISRVLETFWKEETFNDFKSILKYVESKKELIIDDDSLFVLLTYFCLNNFKKINRGSRNDILHSIYIYYSDLFLSEDYHFLNSFKKDAVLNVKDYIDLLKK